jgi:hypothetical protein
MVLKKSVFASGFVPDEGIFLQTVGVIRCAGAERGSRVLSSSAFHHVLAFQGVAAAHGR